MPLSEIVEQLVPYGMAAWVCTTCRGVVILCGPGGCDGGYLAPVHCRTVDPITKYQCGARMEEADPVELLAFLHSVYVCRDGEA